MLRTCPQKVSSHLASHEPGRYGRYTTDLPAPLGSFLKGKWTQRWYFVLWESQPAAPHLLPNSAFFGVRDRSAAHVWLGPCRRGQGGNGELACSTATQVFFPSIAVRRGDICLCRIILGRICMWALGSWGEERSSYRVPSAEAAS